VERVYHSINSINSIKTFLPGSPAMPRAKKTPKRPRKLDGSKEDTQDDTGDGTQEAMQIVAASSMINEQSDEKEKKSKTGHPPNEEGSKTSKGVSRFAELTIC
jgi:hypothetical protein